MTTSRGRGSELSELDNPPGYPEDNEYAKICQLYFTPNIMTIMDDDLDGCSDTSYPFLSSILPRISSFPRSLVLVYCAFHGSLSFIPYVSR